MGPFKFIGQVLDHSANVVIKGLKQVDRAMDMSGSLIEVGVVECEKLEKEARLQQEQYLKALHSLELPDK